MSRTYVEDVEYPEMVFGPEGHWLTCGYCGWDGPMRDTSRQARRDHWRHPDWWCWLRAFRIDTIDYYCRRARHAFRSSGGAA